MTVRIKDNISYVLTNDRKAECIFVGKHGFAVVKAGHAIPPHLWNDDVRRSKARKRKQQRAEEIENGVQSGT